MPPSTHTASRPTCSKYSSIRNDLAEWDVQRTPDMAVPPLVGLTDIEQHLVNLVGEVVGQLGNRHLLECGHASIVAHVGDRGGINVGPSAARRSLVIALATGTPASASEPNQDIHRSEHTTGLVVHEVRPGMSSRK